MQITDITPELKKREEKIRLAAYCRVSSDSEDQIHSFTVTVALRTACILRVISTEKK